MRLFLNKKCNSNKYLSLLGLIYTEYLAENKITEDIKRLRILRYNKSARLRNYFIVES